jgi:polysaccharide biosynthesis/export protein
MMSILTRTRTNLRLGSLMAAMSVLLSACALAPAMRMDSSPSLPVSNAGDQAASEWTASRDSDSAVASTSSIETPDGDRAATSESLAVPISDINVTLIQKLRQEEARQSAVDVARLFAAPGPYTLGIGDVLQIIVWDHPELTAAQVSQGQAQVRPSDAPAGFVVDQTGDIAFPYAGSLNVLGLRTDQVQAQLIRRISRVFRDPQVTVRIASFRSKKVYVDGEVRAPGVEPINDIPMTLYEAITRAGGFTSAADQSRMVLVRDRVSYTVNLPKMIDNKLNPSEILLQDGDLLRIVSRDENGVFVMGEINKPMTAIPLRTGKLSLSDALSQAGSLNPSTADVAQMYVIRGSETEGPQVYRLDGRSAVSMLLANQFELRPKDVVFVDSTGLARFSRVLSQLLPAINAGLTAAIVTK